MKASLTYMYNANKKQIFISLLSFIFIVAVAFVSMGNYIKQESGDSCFTSIFFTLRSNSLRGIITEWSHPSHLMRISIPIRIIFHRFSPHGWAFFISTTSYKLYCFCSILQTPLYTKLLFHSPILHDYIKPYVDMEFQYHVNLDDF